MLLFALSGEFRAFKPLSLFRESQTRDVTRPALPRKQRHRELRTRKTSVGIVGIWTSGQQDRLEIPQRRLNISR